MSLPTILRRYFHEVENDTASGKMYVINDGYTCLINGTIPFNCIIVFANGTKVSPLTASQTRTMNEFVTKAEVFELVKVY